MEERECCLVTDSWGLKSTFPTWPPLIPGARQGCLLLPDGGRGSGCLLGLYWYHLGCWRAAMPFHCSLCSLNLRHECVCLWGGWPHCFWTVVKVLTLHWALSTTTLAFERMVPHHCQVGWESRLPARFLTVPMMWWGRREACSCPGPSLVFYDTIQAGRRHPSYSLMKVESSVLSPGHLLSEVWVEWSVLEGMLTGILGFSKETDQ